MGAERIALVTGPTGCVEVRVLSGDDDVASKHHLHTAAERVAVDPRDHGDVQRGARRQPPNPFG